MLKAIFGLRSASNEEYPELQESTSPLMKEYKSLHPHRVEKLVPLADQFKRNELFNDLLNKMVEIDVSKRYSIDQVRNHPFFDEVRSGEVNEITYPIKIFQRDPNFIDLLKNTDLSYYYETIGWMYHIGRNVSLTAYHYAVELFEQLALVYPKEKYKILSTACLLLGQGNYGPHTLYSNDIEVSLAQNITPREINEMFWSIVQTRKYDLKFNTLYDLLLIRIKPISLQIAEIEELNFNDVNLILFNFIKIITCLIVCSGNRNIFQSYNFISGVEAWVCSILFPKYFFIQNYSDSIIREGNYYMRILSQVIKPDGEMEKFNKYLYPILDNVFDLFEYIEDKVPNHNSAKHTLYDFLSKSINVKL